MYKFIQALQEYLNTGRILIKNTGNRLKLEGVLENILGTYRESNWSWASDTLFTTMTELFPVQEAYQILDYLYNKNKASLNEYQDAAVRSQLTEVRLEAIEKGFDPQVLSKSFESQIRRGMHDITGYETESVKTLNKHHDGYRKNFTSYSGTDMVASIKLPNKAPIVFGELSNISYSIFREKVPVRALGNVNMKGYTRGMKTITGILNFTMFDEAIVFQAMRDIRNMGYQITMDEMPVFDITITMANEFGQQSKLTLHGVTTYTEGASMSVDEMAIQNTYEFYALDISPLERLEDQR